MMQSNSYRQAAFGVCLALVAPVTGQTQHVDEEIVVTGAPVTASPEELAQSVTVLSGAALDRKRAANLGETLAGELGVSASYFGAGASRPIIRGLAGPRVRMLEDGIDSLDVSNVSVDHAVSIDPLAAEQIEIFRGPTTLLFGSGAVGGVVNTVTNRIPEYAPEDGLTGAAELRGDTVADDRTLSLALDGGGDRLAWHLDAMTRASDDYDIPGYAELGGHDEEERHEELFGVLENSDIEVENIAGGISWLGDNAFFGVSLGSLDSNYGLPGHDEHHEEEEAADAAGGEAAARIDLGQTRFDVKGGWLGLGGPIETINLRLGSNDYEHVELEGSEIGTRFENDAWEARLEFLHSPWGGWRGAFGLQVTDRDFSAIGEQAFVPPTVSRSYGLFLLEQRETALWQLSMGARLETRHHDPAGPQGRVDGSASSISFAAIRELGSGHALALNLANAERLPGTEELFSDGPHLATGNIEVGDATLGSETSRHLDLSLRETEGELTWTVTAFLTDYDDYIYLRDTGAIDPDAALPIFAYSQADARFVGLETELFTPLVEIGSGEIDLRLFADYVEAKLRSGEPLPRIPPRRLGARIQYHNDRFNTGIEAVRHDDQDRTARFEAPTPGYTMLNADLSWTLAGTGGTSYELFIRGTNLLDEDARRHSSFLKDAVPLPGRNYLLGLRTSF